MFLYQSLNTDFVLVEADWSVEKGLNLVRNLKPARVIVRRREKDGKEIYYLYEVNVFTALVKDKNSQDYLRTAVDWKDADAVPILSDTLSTTDLNTADAPARGVVMGDGRLAGFWEKPPQTQDRGVTRGLAKGGKTLVGRSLQAGFPAKVALNETKILKVWLIGSGEGVPLKSRVPVGAELYIKVEARKGFKIDGPDHGLLKVKDPPDNEGLDFKLRSTSAGTGEIWVWAFLNGFEMAGLSLTPEVKAGPAADAPMVKNQNSLTLVPTEQPDLFLTISEESRNGKRGFCVNIHCPSQEIYTEKYDFVPFEQDPGKYFEEFYQDIESFEFSTEAERIKTAELLEDKGNHLFQVLFPPDLQQLLWNLRDSITSIYIQSDEPWIPWELCRPSGKVNDRYEEGKFWCESFAVSRWLRTFQRQSIKPAVNLTLNCIATVIPDNPDLLYAIQEADYLNSFSKGGRVVKSIPPTFQRLQIAMESGSYDGWHFSGHGIFNYSDPDRSEIRLQDGALKPENLSGKARNLGNRRPLVFLNACQIGRGGMSLTGVGGWASRFLEAGAGAFIGPLWSVYDGPACKFTEVLYAELFKGSNIGEAVRLARLAIKETGDPSWLAYSVFAYPMAKVSS